MSNRKLGLVATSLVASLAMAGSASSTPAVASQDEDRVNLNEVLREVEIEMAAISEHAAKLEQMVEWPERYTTHSHEYEWLRIQSKFNHAGELIPKMQNASDIAPWKKNAVDEIASLIKAMKAQIDPGLATLEATTSVERLHLDETYPIRATSVRFYADHIGGIIDYIERRGSQTTS